MGNQLSPLSAKMFMDNFEKTIHKHSLKDKILHWFRYVNDILLCFTGQRSRQLKTLENFINSLHPNLKITTDMESINGINFLDLTITKINNKHDFSIYHKPSHTDIIIHNTSNHLIQHKLDAYNSKIHRLVNIPLSLDNFIKELRQIKQIAYNNGFDPKLIDKILYKKTLQSSINLVYPKNVSDNNQVYSLIYIGKTSEKTLV